MTVKNNLGECNIDDKIYWISHKEIILVRNINVKKI